MQCLRIWTLTPARRPGYGREHADPDHLRGSCSWLPARSTYWAVRSPQIRLWVRTILLAALALAALWWLLT